jgi:hypothetical protein
MLVHKSCDLKDVDGRDAAAHVRRGIYFLGMVEMSFELFNTPSGQGGTQIVIANDYSFNEGGAFINSIECYDCGNEVAEFPHSIELYKLERQMDSNPLDLDLEEVDEGSAPCAHCFNPKFSCSCGVAK